MLAAGAGRRFGMPKALARYQGELLVDRAARTLAEGGCAPVVVVLGAAAGDVTRQAKLTSTTVLLNEDWPTGMASSLVTALAALEDTDSVAALVLPVDMPGVTAEAVRRVGHQRAPSALAAASYAGVRGHPVLLGRDHWSGIRASAKGDAGAREYLRSRDVALISCDDIARGFDIDYPEHLRDGDT